MKTLIEMAHEAAAAAVAAGTCQKCGVKVVAFKDEISKAEYKLSGWCQNCQDAFFDAEDE
jgi:hypothetical protein